MKLHEIFESKVTRTTNDKLLKESVKMCKKLVSVLEAWDEKTETPKSEQGKYKGKTKAELKKMLANVKKTGPHKKGSKEYERQNELEFAIRAKSDWGKVNEGYSRPVDEANYEGGIDFEPQPEYAGVKGVTRDTGAGNQAAAAAAKKQAGQKLNQTWVSLLSKMKQMNPAQAEQLKVNLQKVAAVAKQKGFELSPDPEVVFTRIQ